MFLSLFRSFRSFSTQLPNVPGLIHHSHFLDQTSSEELYHQTLELQSKITLHREKVKTTHQSQLHNLPFEKQYKLLHFEDTPGKKINAQTFTNYGSPGHDLTYFIDNPNIPTFIKDSLIRHLETLPPIQSLIKQKNTPLNWRFTLNIYHNTPQTQAGFDWHTDIAPNGEITTITTLIGSALFKIRQNPTNPTTPVFLTPGSLVLLSGPARWDYEHCVVPQQTTSKHRISLVLGCR